LCVDSGLEIALSPVQRVLSFMYRTRNWKSGQGPIKGCRSILVVVVLAAARAGDQLGQSNGLESVDSEMQSPAYRNEKAQPHLLHG
jgi:hypothetical protein